MGRYRSLNTKNLGQYVGTNDGKEEKCMNVRVVPIGWATMHLRYEMEETAMRRGIKDAIHTSDACLDDLKEV